MEDRMPLVVVIYLATVLLIFAVGFAAGEGAVYWQIASSLLLLTILVGVLWWTGLGRRRTEAEPPAHIFSRHLAVFALAMAARSVFIAFFNYPAEKVSIVYLVVLTAFFVEGRSKQDIGVSGVKWGRNVFAGITLGILYYYLSQLVYSGGAQILLGSSPRLVPTLQSAYDLGWVVATSFLLSALSEELLFRGYIQGGVEKVIGRNHALIYSALLFGLWHTAWGIPFAGDPVFASVYAVSYMLFASLSGIVLGVAYRSTKNLILPIFMHGLWNTFVSVTPVASASPTFIGDPWRPLSFGLVVVFLYLVIPRIARFLKIERLD